MIKPQDIIRTKRDEKNLTQTQMAEMLASRLKQSYSMRQYQRIEDGEFPKFKTQVIREIDTILGTSVYDIIYDQNVPHENKPYHKKRAEIKNVDNGNTLTYYEVGAAAGHAAEILPVNKSEGVLHISDLFKGSQFAIRISGNSMTPNYPSGAIIGIREIPDKQITPGSVYVIEKDSDLWIKRLYYKNEDQAAGIFQCVSDNTMVQETGARAGKLYYPMFEIEMDKVRRLFKVTGIYKANELTVIN